jgi:ribosome maturation factor RimP
MKKGRSNDPFFIGCESCKEKVQYTPRNMESRKSNDALYFSLEPVIRGMGMSLVELSVYSGASRTVQIRAVVYRTGIIGIEDCSKVHRGILPRLELAFPEREIYLEVSSPGIDRIIKDGSEFIHYIGREVKCYRTDISDWTIGILCSADEEKILLRVESGEIALPFELIAKARLAGGL